MTKVKKLLEAGASIPDAIKIALGMTVLAFCERYDLSPTATSQMIQGGRKPSEKLIAAFIGEQGGTPDEWKELLWLAGKPETSAA